MPRTDVRTLVRRKTAQGKESPVMGREFFGSENDRRTQTLGQTGEGSGTGLQEYVSPIHTPSAACVIYQSVTA